MDRKMAQDLDRWITGNYGEDQFKRSPKRPARFRVGQAVFWNNPESDEPLIATVVRHGRDASGVYTEIRVKDADENIRVHRSQLSVE